MLAITVYTVTSIPKCTLYFAPNAAEIWKYTHLSYLYPQHHIIHIDSLFLFPSCVTFLDMSVRTLLYYILPPPILLQHGIQALAQHALNLDNPSVCLSFNHLVVILLQLADSRKHFM